MRARHPILAVWIVLVLPLVVFADPAGTNVPAHAALILSDGSRVLGIPRIASIPLQTAYAKMDIPLKQIQNINIEGDHETVALSLTNGDRLKGTLQLKLIEMETLFGIVKIDFTLVAGISVYSGGAGSLPGTLGEGLVLYYSFDKDEGDKVTDASGKGNSGEVKGATWTPDGKVGGAYDFDGRDDYMCVADSSSLEPTGDFTISFWIRLNSPSNARLFSKGTIAPGYAAYMIDIEKGTYFSYLSSNGSSWSGMPAIGAFSGAGKWQHIVVRRTGNLFETFLDTGAGGTLSSSASLYNGTRGIDISGYLGGSEFFNGSIDEVLIYNRALSADEVKSLYDAQK